MLNRHPITIGPFQFEINATTHAGWPETNYEPGVHPWVEIEAVFYQGQEIDTTRWFNDEFEEELQRLADQAAGLRIIEPTGIAAVDHYLERHAA